MRFGKMQTAATAGLLSLVFLAGGCAGGNQLENTVYDIHRRTVKLDQDLSGSVTKLNETSAELVARVNESDQQTRTLVSMLEENQVKLDRLQRTVDNLTTRLYRERGLTTPGGTAPGAPTDIESGTPTITPPDAPPGETPAVPPTGEPPLLPPPQTAVPDDAAAPSMAAGDPEADYQAAQKSYANEDYALAAQQFDAYLQRYPNTDLCGNAQFWKGYCSYNLNKYEESVAEFEKMRSNYPEHTKIPFALHIEAMAYKQLGQDARAVELFGDVVKNYPMTAAADRSKAELEKLKK